MICMKHDNEELLWDKGLKKNLWYKYSSICGTNHEGQLQKGDRKGNNNKFSDNIYHIFFLKLLINMVSWK